MIGRVCPADSFGELEASRTDTAVVLEAKVDASSVAGNEHCWMDPTRCRDVRSADTHKHDREDHCSHKGGADNK